MSEGPSKRVKVGSKVPVSHDSCYHESLNIEGGPEKPNEYVSSAGG